MKNKYLFLILLMGLTYTVYAQSGLTVKGCVKEYHSKVIMQGATLLLKAGNKGLLQTVSNAKGEFSFQKRQPGEYLLITSYLSFKTDTQYIYLKNDTTVPVNLQRSNLQLAEVKVKSDVSPVTVKGDTVVFNAAAYKTKPFATVDELLKMLPGTMIDKDGNVTMNGQKIDKILIDGKSFFIDDLRKATKIFPAEIISKIEIYSSQSEEADRAGIVNYGSSTKTINLTIKDDKKNSLFGKAYAGAGNNDTYAAGGNFSYLHSKELFSIQASSDNINNQFTGTEDSHASASGGNQQLNVLGINYTNQFDKKLNFTSYVNYNFSKTSQQNSSFRQTFLSDSSLLNIDKKNTSGTQGNLKSGINIEYKPNDHNSVLYRFSVATLHNSQSAFDTTLLNVKKADMEYPGSNGVTDNVSQQNGVTLENSLFLIHRFIKKRRSLMVSLNQNSGRHENPMGIKTEVQTYNPVINQIVDQQVLNPVWNKNYGASIQYQEPLGKLNLGIVYLVNSNFNEANKTSNDFNPATKQYDIADTLNSDHFTSSTVTNLLKLTLNGGSKQFIYLFALGEQVLTVDDNNITRGMKSDRTYFNFSPETHLRFDFKNGKSANISYSGQGQVPTVDQLQPIADLSNPYLEKLGNPDLQQAFTHRVRLGYFMFNPAKVYNIQLNVQADIIQHQITAATMTLPGGIQQIQYVNMDGVYHFFAGPTFGFPLISPSNGTASIQTDVTYGHDRSIINGDENTTQSEGLSGMLVFNYHQGKNLFINFGCLFQYQSNHYSIPNIAGNISWQASPGMSVTYSLPFSISTGGTYALQSSKTAGQPVQQSNLLSAFLSKSLSKDQSFQLRASGFNLLNAASNISQTIGPDFIETTKTNALHRFVLLSVVYNFINAAKGG